MRRTLGFTDVVHGTITVCATVSDEESHNPTSSSRKTRWQKEADVPNIVSRRSRRKRIEVAFQAINCTTRAMRQNAGKTILDEVKERGRAAARRERPMATMERRTW